jgi:hypothetical protein
VTRHEKLEHYCNDLAERVAQRDEWRLRHPDWDTQEFRREHLKWSRADDEEATTMKFLSSFNPNDLEPNTSDILTTDIFLALMEAVLRKEKTP